MIYFMRHGQTDFNKENKWMGLLDIPLNENGISQAHSSISFIKSLNIRELYLEAEGVEHEAGKFPEALARNCLGLNRLKS